MLLSNEANEQGLQLIRIMAGFLQSEGVQLDKSKLGGNNSEYGSKPELSTLDALKILQDDVLKIVVKNQLNFEETAQSAAVATGFIEDCKTVPPNYSESSDKQSNKKPWYKFWE